MKKSLLALAVLGAFAGAASAQSTVTLYGRVDLSAAKPLGTKNKAIQNGSGSRLGFRGVEDLGGGLKAFFQIEHRFDADTGFVSLQRFWHARSIVGFEGGFGRFWLGREYTPAFLMSYLLSDPWGFDTVAQINVGQGTSATRNDSTVNYQWSGAGFTVWGQVGEGTDTLVNTPDRPVGVGLSYGAGPLYVAYGYDDQGGERDKWHHFTANYDFGRFKILSGFGTGRNVADLKVRTWQLAATMPVGAGEFRIGHGQRKDDLITGGSAKTVQKTGIGYHYNLSKRTTVYVDYANDSKVTTPVGDPEKNAYDIGVKHNF